ncbi:thiolase C-terminal domain-containing protein [Streptomyces gilvus]|uniref:thiolase C-terminal domain-containing protein n=1 Tax=Streptomyces gilvus TaxID=2920937 RepID=UPI001F0DDE37|nr:hypothetical protein [Streptomyces sp. CME 23]MCH5677586.1 hypothetical protein [Streptomyces sp. CME 23]
MTAPQVRESAAGLFRVDDGLGVWPHRGRVAAVGIGHSPTARRWDGAAETSIGAWTILAVRRAVADAGVDPAAVDVLVLDRHTTGGGSPWPEGAEIPREVAERFRPTDDPLDGVARLSPQWLLANLPELSGVKLVVVTTMCMSMALTAAIETVGRGHGTTAIAVKAWHNFPGRYGVRGANADPTVSGPAKHGVRGAGIAGANSFMNAMEFRRYLFKYGKSREMMAPFVVNSRANGLLMPEGYWAQHDPRPLTAADYLGSRMIADPSSLLDNDLPVHAAAAYLVTTAERAVDLRQPPAYVLGHAGSGVARGDRYDGLPYRSVVETLEESEAWAAATARRVYESAAVRADDLAFENCYDGFSFLHPFWLEAFGYAGVRHGEALDFYQGDIGLKGPHPVSPSGGNIGGGRTRFWGHTDSIQQIQQRAGARQIGRPATIGLSGGFMPYWSNFVIWSRDPDGP